MLGSYGCHCNNLRRCDHLFIYLICDLLYYIYICIIEVLLGVELAISNNILCIIEVLLELAIIHYPSVASIMLVVIVKVIQYTLQWCK